MIYTYVLESKKDGKWYTGFTHDLRERFKQHNNGKVFSTKGRGPFKIIYYEACNNEKDATMREKYLKTGMGKRYLKNRLKRSLSLTGFTLIELIVTVAIIAVLSGVILFSVTQYIAKGKDSNIAGNLAILIPAGEVWYNGGGSYQGFCEPGTNSVIKNVVSQMPLGTDFHCHVERYNKAWAACAIKFSDPTTAFCVDSRGMKEDIEIAVNPCSEEVVMTQCP